MAEGGRLGSSVRFGARFARRLLGGIRSRLGEEWTDELEASGLLDLPVAENEPASADAAEGTAEAGSQRQ